MTQSAKEFIVKKQGQNGSLIIDSLIKARIFV